jgi:hypothetical protein
MADAPTDQWLAAARHELGLEEATGSSAGLDAATELSSLVSGTVGPSVAPATVFLLGLAAGRAAEPSVAARDFTEKLGALARSWNADTDRAEAPNDQDRRG